jgi:subtilisin-like proprotein convertase family protein
MERRTFLALLGFGTLALPLAARAQQRGKVPVVGVLNMGAGPRAFTVDTARQGLRDLGYVEGQTIAFDVMVKRYIGTQPNRFKITFDTNIAALEITEYDTHSPTVTPHAVLTACGVGAYSYYNQRYAEPYSSTGPLVTLFDPEGNRYPDPHVIQQPRIVAPDKVNTSFFYNGIDSDHDNFPNFPGTSAAAPHAAAVAALIRQANPTFTPLQVLGRMEVFADSTINAPGNDPLTGSGKVDAYRAIKGDPQAAEPDFSDGFESSYLNQYWETYARDAGRVAVSNNTFPQSGAWHLRMGSDFGVDQSPNYILHSLSEAILHVNAAGANNLELAFYARTYSSGINGYLPVGTDYTGHTENSGVSFSVDGVNWHAIVNLSGLGSAYQQYTVDLVGAAALEGVTLTNDTQIRFAAVASNGFPTNGLGLDSVTVTRHGKLSGHIINDLNGDGFNTSEPGIAGRRAYHDLDRNGRFDRTAETFNSSGGPVAIPDFSGSPSTVTSPIVVSGTNGPLLDLEVAVDITHTFTGDVTLFLNGPGGQRVQLFNRHGSNGDNLAGTIFDDQALTPVSTGYGPFNTRYRPYASFNPFFGLSGSSINGTWTLEIHDNASGDVGTLNSWTLILKTASKYTNNNSVSIPDFYSTGSITTLAGPSTARSYATISGLTGPVNHVTVGININHSYDGDLTAFLVSPSGVRVQLLDRFGGSGNNFTNTLFDDFAATYIGAGSAPFTGTFRPVDPLGLLTGLTGTDLNGTWTLEVHDNALNDTGSIANWSLTIESGEPYAITDSSGSYSFVNMAPAPANPGNYILNYERLAGWRQTYPFNNSAYFVTYPNGTDYTGRDFLLNADTTAPSVSSLARVGPAATSASTVVYVITFSEPVSNLTPSNFHLETSGLTGASIQSILGSGANYDITVATGTGDGVLTLNFVDSRGLVDAGHNAVTPSFVPGPATTIDRTAPTATITIGAGTAQRSRIESLTVTFSEQVIFAGQTSAAFQLERLPSGGAPIPVAFTVSTALVNGQTVATLTPTSDVAFGSLIDGRYRLTVLANQIADLAGNLMATNLMQTFHRYYGDVNGDEHIDIADFGSFSTTFNLQSGQQGFLSYLDYNHDNHIDIADFGQFSIRLFTVLP